MNLSQHCFNIHSKLKTIFPNIKRSQVYELMAGYFGHHSYKHFKEDAILLSGDGYSYFSFENQTIIEKRLNSFNLPVSSKHIEQVVKIIYDEFVSNKVYAPSITYFVNELYYILDDEGLNRNPIYRDLYQSLTTGNMLFQSVVSYLLLLRIKLMWDEETIFDYTSKNVIHQAVKKFGTQKILPYLIVLDFCNKNTKYFDYPEAFKDEYCLRETIEKCLTDDRIVEAHAWYQFALRINLNDILKEQSAMVYYTNFGEGFYDDGEWFDFVEGEEEIVLPDIDEYLLQQVEKKADEYYQLYQDVKYAVCYTKRIYDLYGDDYISYHTMII